MGSLFNFLFPAKLAKVREDEDHERGGDMGTSTVYRKNAHREWRLKPAMDPKSSLPSFHWTRIRPAK